jgi:hypothetical protein
MKNKPTPKELAVLPKLYETGGITPMYKMIYMHFFCGGCDWYIVEYDRKDTFYGFTILHDNLWNADWGYISFKKLRNFRSFGFETDRELDFKPVQANTIERIRRARWNLWDCSYAV